MQIPDVITRPGFFVYPQLRVKDSSEKPTARAGMRAKARRGLAANSLTAASTRGENAHL
jgi:hypothetical protein